MLFHYLGTHIIMTLVNLNIAISQLVDPTSNSKLNLTFFQYSISYMQLNRNIFDLSANSWMNIHFLESPSQNQISFKKSSRSKYQHLLHNFVLYIHIISHTGLPVHHPNSGNSIPCIFGMVMNILVLILACMKVPKKLSFSNYWHELETFLMIGRMRWVTIYSWLCFYPDDSHAPQVLFSIY